MEPRVDRYTFRLEFRGEFGECGGRVVVGDDGLARLQVWMFTSEQRNVLLEVTGCDDVGDLWPLFRKVCDYRGVKALQYRRIRPSFGPWEDVPHGAGPSPKRKKDQGSDAT